jgi:hypothetical protein
VGINSENMVKGAESAGGELQEVTAHPACNTNTLRYKDPLELSGYSMHKATNTTQIFRPGPRTLLH